MNDLELHLREISITATHDDTWHFYSFSITFELDLKWGVETEDQRVPILLKFTYLARKNPYIDFSGRLWQADTDLLRNLNPTCAPVPALTPITPQPQYYISLLDMDGIDPTQKSSLQAMGRILPTTITSLQLSCNTNSVSFSGMMVVDPKAPSLPDQPAPWLVLEKVFISAVYTNNYGSLAFTFQAEILLNPREAVPPYCSIITTEIDYDSSVSGWTVIGTVSNLNVGALYSLFPDSDNDAVMNLMEHITIQALEITFHHDKQSMQFSMSADILLGEIELDLDFVRDDSGWTFSAILSADFTSNGYLLGDLLGGISPELKKILPDFVASIDFAIPTGSSIALRCQKAAAAEDGTGGLMVLVSKSPYQDLIFVSLKSPPPRLQMA